ncbi:MAG: iron-containing alcohol dehydrogenase [Treponema sp.]|uniref:iron-containing alcohol dehydrogenase n=1 Tax=Treponema sp. TaxID=166 RepID=UPI00298DB550|nr:iron-containing alcohol dehydrogenase [Treponema sp.]MCQ2600955.1 iron-containing alcohol dehydrogenase [Treponema sp.]
MVINFNFTSAPCTIFGEGALKKASPYFNRFGKKALIVTGKIITKAGLTSQVQNMLSELGIESVVFNDLPGEPDDIMINNGIKVYKDEECDFIIGLGGGTPLDSAKAIAAMSVLPGKLADYAGKEMSGAFPPLVLIPTTAGTGSEVTKFLVFTDTATDAKLLLKGEDLLPDLAIIDYNFTISSPETITIATGMDALTHAIEAYTSKRANAMTDMICVDAVKRIFENIKLVVENPQNKSAREQMSLAAYEAGICINNSSVTLVHGMSRPIGALFHVPHGISNAMLLVECLRFALDGAKEKFADLGRAIGAASYSDDDDKASVSFLYALQDLTMALKIPSLREYGIDLEKFENSEEKMAQDAIASGSPGNTCKIVTKEDIVSIYEILRKK